MSTDSPSLKQFGGSDAVQAGLAEGELESTLPELNSSSQLQRSAPFEQPQVIMDDEMPAENVDSPFESISDHIDTQHVQVGPSPLEQVAATIGEVLARRSTVQAVEQKALAVHDRLAAASCRAELLEQMTAIHSALSEVTARAAAIELAGSPPNVSDVIAACTLMGDALRGCDQVAGVMLPPQQPSVVTDDGGITVAIWDSLQASTRRLRTQIEPLVQQAFRQCLLPLHLAASALPSTPRFRSLCSAAHAGIGTGCLLACALQAARDLRASSSLFQPHASTNGVDAYALLQSVLANIAVPLRTAREAPDDGSFTAEANSASPADIVAFLIGSSLWYGVDTVSNTMLQGDDNESGSTRTFDPLALPQLLSLVTRRTGALDASHMLNGDGILVSCIRDLRSGMPHRFKELQGWVDSTLRPCVEIERQLIESGFIVDHRAATAPGPANALSLSSMADRIHEHWCYVTRQRTLRLARDICGSRGLYDSVLVGSGGAGVHFGVDLAGSDVAQSAITPAHPAVPQSLIDSINTTLGTTTTAGASTAVTAHSPIDFTSLALRVDTPDPCMRMRVSRTAHEVGELVRQLLIEATCSCGSSGDRNSSSAAPSSTVVPSAVSASLVSTAIDCIHLYRSVVPARFGSKITTIPMLPMLLHNDCVYLASLMAGGGAGALCGGGCGRSDSAEASVVSSSVSTVAKQHPVNTDGLLLRCVSVLPPLQSLAQSSLIGQLRRQRDSLSQLAAGGTGPLSKHAVRDGRVRLAAGSEEAESLHAHGAAQVDTLSRLSSSWREMLPHQVYLCCLTFLCDVSLERCCRDIMTIVDAGCEIGEEASRELAAYCRLLVDAVRDVITAPTLAAAGASNNAPGATASPAASASIQQPSPSALVRHFARCTFIAETLDAPLAVIGERVSSGWYGGRLGAVLRAHPQGVVGRARRSPSAPAAGNEGTSEAAGGLSSPELARLLTCLFDDSEEREAVIAALKR